MTRDNKATNRGNIVVGVDGSDSSKAALEWAATQARLSGEALVAIAAWEWPTSYGAMVSWPANVDFEEDARKMLAQCVVEVLGAHHAEVTQQVVHSHPAPALEDASRSAALLVVGCRGHGEFAGMLLGSVGEFLATHAHCPVVIIRGDKTSDD